MKQEVVKGKEEKEGVGAPKCFNCGKRGHKKFECPNKVARVTGTGRIVSPKVRGRVNNRVRDDCRLWGIGNYGTGRPGE